MDNPLDEKLLSSGKEGLGDGGIVQVIENIKYESFMQASLQKLKVFPEKGIKGFESIYSIAYSNNQKYIAAGTSDNNVLIINPQLRKIENSLKGHKEWVNSVAFTPDSLSIVSGSSDKTIKIWNVEDTSLKTTIEGHNSGITSVKVSKDGKYILSGSSDDENAIKIWSMQDYTEIGTLLGHTNSIVSIAINNDNSYIYSSSKDQTIKIWNFSDKTLAHTINTASTILSMTLTSNYIIISLDNRTVILWNTLDYSEYWSLSFSSYSISIVSCSVNEKLLATGAENGIIKVWNIENKQEILAYSGHETKIQGIAFAVDNESITSSSSNERIRFWNINEVRDDLTLDYHTSEIKAVAFSPNGSYAISGSGDSKIHVWNIDDNKLEFTFSNQASVISALVVDKFSRFVVSGSYDKSIWSNSLSSNRRGDFLIGEGQSAIMSLAITSNNKAIVSGDEYGNICLWSIPKKKLRSSFKAHDSVIKQVVLTPDNKHMITSSIRPILKIWTFKEFREVGKLAGHTDASNALVATPNGKSIISGSADRRIIVWNLSEQKIEYELIGHNSPILALCISADGELLVSGSVDSGIKIWDLKNKIELCSLPDHMFEVFSVAINIQKTWILSGDSKKFVKLWKINTKKPHNIIKEYSCGNGLITVSPNKEYIVISSSYSVLWNLNNKTKIIDFREGYKCGDFSEDSKYLLLGRLSQGIIVWNIEKGEKQVSIDYQPWESAESIAMSSDNKYLVYGSFSGFVRVWSIQDPIMEYSVKLSEKPITSIVFSFQNTLYTIFAAHDNIISIIDFTNKSILNVLSGHRSRILSIHISPDRKYIISGSDNGLIKLWNIEFQREEWNFQGHTNKVKKVVFNNEGTHVASVSGDGYIKIWNIKEKREEFSTYYSNLLAYVAFLQDKNQILACGAFSYTIVCNIQTVTEQSKLNLDCMFNFKESVSLQNKVPDRNFEFKLYSLPLSKDVYQLQVTFDKKYVIASGNTDCIYQTNENDFTLRNFPSPMHILDPYFQDPLLFYNVIDALATNNYTNISPNCGNIVLSRYLFTIAHYFSFTGKINELKRIIVPSFKLKCDIFGKSPFYYAIIRKQQNCVDFLIEFLTGIESTDSTQFTESFYAIRNDFSIIIRNSSRLLPSLLNKIFITSENMFAKMDDEDLPLYHYSSAYMPELKDFSNNFITGEIDEIPVVTRYTAIPIENSMGSEKSLILLKSILECNNTGIFTTPLIQLFIQLQWDSLKPWILFYSFMLFANIILFALLLAYDVTNLYILVPFIIVNLILVSWEIVQINRSGLEYFQDLWNIIDISRIFFTVFWIIVNVIDDNQASLDPLSPWYVWHKRLTWIVAVIILIRGLTGFRLFDGTRYYINLIIRSISDIKYFIVMFSYSTFAFGVLFAISGSGDIDFVNLWKAPFKLNFGGDSPGEDAANSDPYIYYIVYLGAIIINVVLVLNMLISILGDSYEQFQMEKPIIDYQEKGNFTYEIQSMLLWKNQESDPSYLHVCASAFADEEGDGWEGRILYMDKKLDKNYNLMQKLTKETSINVESKIELLEPKIELLENRLQERIVLIESKLGLVESKLGSVESNMNQKFEKILTILEEKSNKEKLDS